MLKKIFFILIILNILQGCGYTPMYLTKNQITMNIEEISLSGDWELNNYIKNSLQRYSSESKTEKYKITINTNYNRSSITKDATGKTTNYLFEIETSIMAPFELKSATTTFQIIYLISNHLLIYENFTQS